MTGTLPVALTLVFFLSTHGASGSYPRAQNVTWKSTNFKTILSWEPKPSADYSYTVEFSASGGNKQRNLHCTRSSFTTCDLSTYLTDLKAHYTADVLSEPPIDATSDLIEFPHTSSPRFCPYEDTDIGKPDFKLKVSEDKKKTTLYVTDPLTALFKDGQQLNIRDIFSEQLQYRVTYRRNKSTGKKVYTSKTNEIELSDLDRGESYCFNVQAYIPSRHTDKQLGEMSQTQCSNDDNASIFKVYSISVIACAIFLILLLIGIVVAVTVVCCKRKRKSQHEKDGLPLDVI
ncbi:coagulation factor III, tissue factor a [Stegastes partitus]|uniref:Tissue factor n=1 Tax=Stegastes partitus TaxID=144197 RepID=A0A3B5ADE3_9TELE|nr:PREDICTED: tissue factor-like [Stegastes partitus]